jgi:hypothetical protein
LPGIATSGHKWLRSMAACLILLGAGNACSQAQTAAQIKSEFGANLKDWSTSLALQAATWGAPLVTMYHLRYNDAVGPKPKAAPNSIWRMEDISTPELSVEA